MLDYHFRDCIFLVRKRQWTKLVPPWKSNRAESGRTCLALSWSYVAQTICFWFSKKIFKAKVPACWTKIKATYQGRKPQNQNDYIYKGALFIEEVESLLDVGAAGMELELTRIAAYASPAEPGPVRVRRAVRLEHLDHVELVVVRGDVGLRSNGPESRSGDGVRSIEREIKKEAHEQSEHTWLSMQV